MLIDWFTVIAQGVNFLILVWLLKRFLYRPILNAIDEREARIAAQLRDAEVKKAEAQSERDDFRRKNAEFAEQRDALLRNAADDARTERERLLDEVRQEADVLRTKLHEVALNERESINRDISSRAQQEVFAIACKALTDLADISLEERMTEVFIGQLRQLNDEERRELASLVQSSHHPAVVRSAFELSPTQREAIALALKETLRVDTGIEFEISPSLVSGIELTTNGHKVGWSIAEYLQGLGNHLNEEVEADRAKKP